MQGYTKELISLSSKKLNVITGIAGLLLFILLIVPYSMLWDKELLYRGPLDIFNQYEKIDILLIFGLIIFGVVLHELIHGLAFAKYSLQGFKSIKFGIEGPMATPYCHCKEPITVKQFKIVALLPAFVLGIIPYGVNLVVGNISLLFFSVLMTMGGIADFMLIYSLRKENNTDFAQDHPTENGYYIFRKN